MSILEFQGLAQSFGDFDLFSGLGGSIPADARIGLVGPNGVGKTTLLRFLADRASPSAGGIDRARGLRIGYLPQEAVQAFADRHHDVYREMLAVFKDLREDETRLRALEREISEGADDEETLERYGKLQAAFELAGGYTYEQRIQRVLTGLGFPEENWDQSLDELSGGQKTRILLARLLLEAPDLLIMDEPTNHLDVETIAWLEGMLTATEGALLVVSHDRYFLDRVANVIWEMSPTRIERYRGNYSAYVLQRRERWEQRAKAYEDMMARFEKELDFIRRNIAGQRGQMAKGKLSRLGREVEAVHAGGLEMIDVIRSKGWLQATAEFDLVRPSDKPNEVARRIGELRPPTAAMPEIKLELATIARGGDFVLRSKDLVVGYDGIPLLEVDDLELMRGERVALIGGNGTGKTTLLKTLLNEIPVISGELKPGAGLDIGYFAQAHDNLSPDETVLDTLMQQTDLKVGEARSYLAKFLFKSDEVFNRVGSLSGGERGRLALSILARRNANFLLLDEPTNHLDIQAQEILESVLSQYSGTLLMVSHDRYLVRRLATQIWAVEDGRLTVHPWGYDEYLETQRLGAEEAAARRAAAAERASDASETSGPKLSKNEIQRRRSEAAQIELEIAEEEERMGDLEVSLQNAGENGDFEAMHELGEEHAGLRARIEGLYARWDAIASEIAEAEAG